MKFFYYTGLVLFILNVDACKNPDEPVIIGTPGLVTPLVSDVQIRLNSFEPFELRVCIAQGLPVESVKIMKTYCKDDRLVRSGGEIKMYGPIMMKRIDVQGNNADADIDLKSIVTYEDLGKDLGLTGEGMSLNAGDKWYINYEAVMVTGEVIMNHQETTVSIVNEYAGACNEHIIHHNPSAGRYPDNVVYETTRETKVTTVNEWISTLNFRPDDGSSTGLLVFSILTDNKIDIEVRGMDYDIMEGDPKDSLKISHYDPETGIIYLYYHYGICQDYHIIWETLTPVE